MPQVTREGVQLGGKPSPWQEADRADRLRYAQPAQLRGHVPEFPSSRSVEPGGQAASVQGTHYDLLGVDRNASQAQIRRAYLRLLVTAHPDKGGEPERFQQLQAAFGQLSDPTQRVIYDEKLDRMQERSAPCSLSSRGGAQPLAGHSYRQAAGVTAVVHGQTQGRRQPPGPVGVQAAACSAGCSTSELQEATAAIRELQASTSASSSQLAEAHLRRSMLHQAAGQLHHALFDAEEALRIQPDSTQAAALASALLQAMQAPAALDDDEQDSLDDEL